METEQERLWFVGVDWGSQTHQVHVADAQGRERGKRGFAHTGEGLAGMAAWILQITGATANAVHVAIEVPHGPVVESLMERGFNVYSINPKQLDRFRDRFSPSGAKDDSRDCLVLCDSLRTDPRSYRALAALDPVLVELREWSRILEELGQDRIRLTNRLWAQLWRYYPQIVTLTDDVAAPWFIALWQLVPTPDKAIRARKSSIAQILKKHRIRRISTDNVLEALRVTAIPMAPGTVDAAVAHIQTLIKRLEPVQQQLKNAEIQIDTLTERFSSAQENPAGQAVEQRDVMILRSLPGVGRIILATLLTEAADALHRRDYHALRCLSGVAPVTKRSGKSHRVVMRRAVHVRLRNSIHQWTKVAVQHDPRSRARYDVLRARGHSYNRALRTVGDRLLGVACAMLESQTCFDPNFAPARAG